MTFFLKTLLLPLFVTCLIWIPQNYDQALKSDPLIVCAPPAFKGQIMRSSDSGGNWEVIGQGLPGNMKISASRAVGDDLLVASNLDHIFMKNSKGSCSWEQIHLDYETNFKETGISLLVQDFYPVTSGVYIHVSEAGLFKKEKGSSEWKHVQTPREQLMVNEILEGKNGEIYLASHEGLFLSTDEGNSWKRMPLFGYVYSVDLRDDILFATGENGIFNSKDGGQSWTKAYTPNDKYAFTIPHGDQYYYLIPAGTDMVAHRHQTAYNFGLPGKFLISHDNGEKWEIHPADDYLKDLEAIVSLIIDENGVMYCSYKEGVVRSIDNGKNWEKILSYQPSNMSMGLFLSLSNGILYCTEANAGC